MLNLKLPAELFKSDDERLRFANKMSSAWQLGMNAKMEFILEDLVPKMLTQKQYTQGEEIIGPEAHLGHYNGKISEILPVAQDNARAMVHVLKEMPVETIPDEWHRIVGSPMPPGARNALSGEDASVKSAEQVYEGLAILAFLHGKDLSTGQSKSRGKKAVERAGQRYSAGGGNN